MLWTTIGALFYLSQSLYLVVVFHGVMNTLLNTLHYQFGDISSMLVHVLALFLVVMFALLKSRAPGMRSDPE